MGMTEYPPMTVAYIFGRYDSKSCGYKPELGIECAELVDVRSQWIEDHAVDQVKWYYVGQLDAIDATNEETVTRELLSSAEWGVFGLKEAGEW